MSLPGGAPSGPAPAGAPAHSLPVAAGRVPRLRSRATTVAENLLLATVFLLAVLRSLEGWGLYPDVAFPFGEAWVEIALWILAVALMASLLGRRTASELLLARWRAEPALAAFVGCALLSTLWSAQPAVTLHRSLALAGATVAALYLGGRYDAASLHRILLVVCAALLVGSVTLALFVPTRGADPYPPYFGAWNGLFWHKNHFGALLPLFALVFLFRIFSWDSREARGSSLLAPALLLLALFSLAKSNCAAGLVVTVALAAAVCLAWARVRIGPRWRGAHTAVVVGCGAGALVTLALQREAILALLERNETLTGRLPLWANLLERAVPRHPWLGAGFGTAWADGRFRSEMREHSAWTADPMIADNGFLDVLLNTGAVGFLLFAAVYLGGWRRAIRAARHERTMASCFPPLFFLYTLLANLTFSLFAETELLVWMVMIALTVQAAPGARQGFQGVAGP